jgi:hypothetical protein
MEDRWVINLSEDRKRFYLVSSLLDLHTKMLSFCDNKYFPSSWKDDDLGYFSMNLKSFYVQPVQKEVKDSDGQVKHRIDLDELLGMSTTSMKFILILSNILCQPVLNLLTSTFTQVSLDRGT